MEEKLMMEAWHSFKSEEERGLFPLPTFSLIVNCSPLSSWGVVPSHPPACKPQNHPILINHFLSISLPLVEFFLSWNTKDQSSSEPPERQPSSFNWRIEVAAMKSDRSIADKPMGEHSATSTYNIMRYLWLDLKNKTEIVKKFTC